MIKAFRVHGFAKGEKFSIDVAAIDKEHAIDKVYSNLGSKFGVKRTAIKITDVEEITFNDTKSRVLKQLHGEI